MNITLERMQQIEQERAQVQSDPEFRKWAEELNVGRMYVDREGAIKANQMMSMWNVNPKRKLFS